jgi:hypothetical protein
MIFLALFFLLGATLVATMTGFFPSLLAQPRLLPVRTGHLRPRLQAPPGAMPWRGSPEPSPQSLV